MVAGTLELAIIAMLAGLSFVCVFAGVRSLGGEIRLVRRMGGLNASSPALRLIETLRQGLGGLLIGGGKDREEIEQNLHVAGYYSPIAPILFVWFRLGATVAVTGGVVGVLTLFRIWNDGGPYFTGISAGATYLLSKRVLGWSAARRRRKIEAEMPFTLDVFLMMLESGVSLDQTFRTFVRAEGRAAPIIKEALTALVADIERGVSYEAALDRWGDRLGVNGARELAALFKRNLAHGSELSGALSGMAHEFTEKRVSNARETVGRKAAQMAVVMMIFFMPALFIVLAGPAFVTLLHSLAGVAR